MAMPMPAMPPMPGGDMPQPQASPFEKFGGGMPQDPSMMGMMGAPSMPAPPPMPTQRPPISKKAPPQPAPITVQEPTLQEEVDVADSYDQMIADMINEYRGLFKWQSQWRRY